LKSVIISAVADWIFYFCLLCHCPLSPLAWNGKRQRK